MSPYTSFRIHVFIATDNIIAAMLYILVPMEFIFESKLY